MKKVVIGIFAFIAIVVSCVLGYVYRDYLFQKGLDTNEVSYREITKQENKDKFNVYLFYSDGDISSEGIKSYFNTLPPEVMETFTLYTFEISTNVENQLLLSNVKQILNDETESTTYLIVGNQYMDGYTENDNVRINTFLDTEKNVDIHYDILDYVNVEQGS